MHIHAHVATAIAIAAPLLVQQAPVASLYTDAHNASYETQQVNEPHDTNLKIISKPQKQTERPKKVIAMVQSGDSLSLIAKSHHTTWVRIFDANKQINDPNIIHPGQKLTVPAKDAKLTNRYASLSTDQVSTMPTVAATTQVSATSVSAAPSHGGSNTYSYGYCTWYVKNQRPDISNHWGNAGYNWISEAKADGYATGSVPQPGAIAVTGGHVAIVDFVSNGKPHISEMNYGGGVGVIHHRTVSPSTFQYIY